MHDHDDVLIVACGSFPLTFLSVLLLNTLNVQLMVQPMHSPSLVGLVVERETNKRSDKNNFPSFKQSSSSTGFPSAQHRSKSAFARLREAKRNELSADAHGISKDEKITTVPVVQTSGSLRSVKSGENEEYDSLKGRLRPLVHIRY